MSRVRLLPREREVILKDTGWQCKVYPDKTIDWSRRIGFITMLCYRSQQKPARYEAYIVAEPFGTIRKEFRSQASPKKFCEKIISDMYWRMHNPI